MSYRLGRTLDHVHLHVADLERSKRFYRALCDALELEEAFIDGGHYFAVDELYVDAAPGDRSRVHLAFQAKSHAAVEAFFRLAVAAGGSPNGGPGLRRYHKQYYAAFVLDPDGNNIEAVCDAPVRRSAAAITVERL